MINFNGKIISAADAAFPLNRAMNYGDGLFETIRIHNGQILFFEDHLERMFRAMKALKIEIPEKYSDFFFHKQIVDLAHQENIDGNARVKIGIYRSGRGLYEPESLPPEYFMEVLSISHGYGWKNEFCEARIYRDVPKDFSTISFFKSMNALCYVLAAIYKKENNLGDCFLLNSSGKVADAVSSNIFLFRKKKSLLSRQVMVELKE